MANTTFEFTEVPRKHLGLGYRWEEQQWKDEPLLHDGIFGAMGGLITTVSDFSKYIAFHQSAWPQVAAIDQPLTHQELPHAKLPPIRKSSLREMHQPGVVIGLLGDDKTSDGATNPRVVGYGHGLHWSLDKRGVVFLRHAGRQSYRTDMIATALTTEPEVISEC